MEKKALETQLTIRMPRELRRQYEELASLESRTLTQIIRIALEKYLQNSRQAKKAGATVVAA